MHNIDIAIFLIYFLALIGIGFYFFGKNKTDEDYYVGGRGIGKWHIGLSVVATDVGGGFSIGLGGLGFVMGLSGSWLLFTGLIGAWIAALVLVPRVWKLSNEKKLLTFPQLFEHFYDGRVALLAGIISALGYIGFTSSQVLAGAKLANAAFPLIDLENAVFIMGGIIIGYTVLGGMKAVIFTDTIQWSILITGLALIGIPVAYNLVGGWQVISDTLSHDYFSLSNLTWQQFINWMATIVPIWFVGMTLYQRIYATKSSREAQKAWFIAGVFEWPIMAFLGVTLGLLAKVAATNGMFSQFGYSDPSSMDPELGLPLLLVHVLPVGLLGIMMSVYFSAIMSTADSCLMASSGNVLTDILMKSPKRLKMKISNIRLSQIVTLLLGGFALLLAVKMSNVLELMLYSYAFMVSGLFVPVLGAIYLKKPNPQAAFFAMILGGGTTISLIIADFPLPLGLDPNVFGIAISAIVFFSLNSLLIKNKNINAMKIQVYNTSDSVSTLEKKEIVDFLYKHLDEYGDKWEHIERAVDYALNHNPAFGGFVLYIKENGTMQGAVVINKTNMKGYIPENILVYIAVHHDFRGNGIGKMLMEKAIQMTEGDIALHVEDDNPARFLYEKVGFKNPYLEMRYYKS